MNTLSVLCIGVVAALFAGTAVGEIKIETIRRELRSTVG